MSGGSFGTPSNIFEVGDMIVKDDGVYCGVIIKKEIDSGGFGYTYTMANSNFVGGATNVTVHTTKNPPYNKDSYDSWGMYKSDIKPTLIPQNENMARFCSPTSSKGVDAWSLRKITSSLGNDILINYEGDTYKKSILNTNSSFILKNIIVQPNGTSVQFNVEDYGMPLDELNIHVGDKLKLQLLARFTANSGASKITLNYNFTVTSVNGTLIAGSVDVVGTIFTAGWEWFHTILTGNLSVQLNNSICGGGLRVKSVKTKDDMGSAQITTKYDYNDLDIVARSSGVTAYSPSSMDIVDLVAIKQWPSGTDPSTVQSYRASLFKDAQNLYAISREAPPPGVIYENVTVSSEVKNADENQARQVEGKTQYQFEVFRDNMVVRDLIGSQESNVLGINQSVRNLVLKKFTGSIGNMKRIIQYDVYGRKLSETINHYLHDDLAELPGTDFMNQYKIRLADFKYQGFVQERTTEVKLVQNSGFTDGIKSTLSGREDYPCIQTGQTVINYVNGSRIKSENLAFDFYSGAITKTVETDTYGNRFMTETVPAYRKYSTMGLKAWLSSQNKNMLTQVAGTYTYKVDGANQKLGLVSANVQTWSDQVPSLDKDGASYVQSSYSLGTAWRKQSSYVYAPPGKTASGLTDIGAFSNFQWNNPMASTDWIKTSEITLYDVYSKGLESIDINNNKSAARMDYANKRTILSGGPANYYEIAYSGVEDEAVNQSNDMFVKKGSGVVTTDAAHTGLKSLRLAPNLTTGLTYTVSTDKLVTGRTYTASVWVKPVSGTTSAVKLFYTFDGSLRGSNSSQYSSKMANGWTLVTLTIASADVTPGHTLFIGCRNADTNIEAYVDDFRFQPSTSVTTASVFDPFSGELSYVLDNNNLYTAYEYDAAGRLSKVYKEKLGAGKLLLNEYHYNMSQPLFVPAPPTILYVRPVFTFLYTYTSGDCTESEVYRFDAEFFWDDACLVPAYVGNIDITFWINQTYNSMVATVPSTPTHIFNLGEYTMKETAWCENSGYNIPIEISNVSVPSKVIF